MQRYRFRHYSSPRQTSVATSEKGKDAPPVTIIRPVKGIEPHLYECLASTFQQDYPRDKLAVHLCIESRDDPAYPILRRVVSDFPQFDARIFVESEDPLLHGSSGHTHNLGPNPKIRNMSRAYREAKGDIIWVIDCNIWVSRGVAGRLVDKLCGYGPGGREEMPYKFVHQLPLVVDISATVDAETRRLLASENSATSSLGFRGGRLDEMFMATAHGKFYIGINMVGVAPCILGKSNMFRKSHLDRLTDPSQNPILSPEDASRGRGIDFFSSNICEDHLIGDLLWRSNVPGHRNHGLVTGDLALQPVAGTSVSAYFARRVRWLRVRKWTVMLATFVEPGSESLLCCFYFSFMVTTLPLAHEYLGAPQTWAAFFACWAWAVIIWMALDWCTYHKLLACQSVEVDDNTPSFACGTGRLGGIPRRPFGEWLLAWLGREMLALPIWIWAVLLGTTVSWRGKRFLVRMDMTVVEIDEKGRRKQTAAANGKPTLRAKGHVD